MKKLFVVLLSVVTGLLPLAGAAYADAPVQIALVAPVQVVDRYDNVKGLRLDLIYGVNYNVSGIDLGLINKVESEQKGIQIGLYNDTFESSGLQVGLVNKTEWLNGVQIGLINIHAKGERKFFPFVNFSF